MNKRLVILSVALGLMVVLGFVYCHRRGSELKTIEYPVGEKVALILEVPREWQVSQRYIEGAPVPAMEFRPAKGKGFALQLSPISALLLSSGFNQPESMKLEAEGMVQLFLPEAEEKSVQLQPLGSPRPSGYYFLLTDKTTKPGEFKYMIRGLRGLEQLRLNFTILFNRRDDPVVETILDVLQSARQKNR